MCAKGSKLEEKGMSVTFLIGDGLEGFEVAPAELV
jgi:hypothetical protein